jgi:nitrite reductase (NADH) large subunit
MSINRLQRPRLVVVGNGMAGNANGRGARCAAPDRFDITVIGGEPHPSYNRILSKPSRQGRRSVF